MKIVNIFFFTSDAYNVSLVSALGTFGDNRYSCRALLTFLWLTIDIVQEMGQGHKTAKQMLFLTVAPTDVLKKMNPVSNTVRHSGGW